MILLQLTKLLTNPSDRMNQVISPVHTLAVKSYILLAVTKSWETPFVGTNALEALTLHVVRLVSDQDLYGPHCSIVQSSGMGKSRLLDQFSKSNFVIPINLRMEGTSGMYA